MAEFDKSYMQDIFDGEEAYSALEEQANSELLTEAYVEEDRRLKAQPKKEEELNYDEDGLLKNDSDVVTTAKEGAGWLLDKIGLGEYAPKVNKEGKTYFTQNKSFTDRTLGDLLYEYENAKEDPNASHLVYTLRKFNGLDDDGNPTFEYKNGVAKVSAYNRYKTQAVKGGWELVREKRFAGASEWEEEFNANGDVLKNRAYDSVAGNKQRSGFGAGYTEILQDDLLAGNDSEKFTRAIGETNLKRSRAFTEQYLKERAKGSSSLGKAFLTGTVKFATDAGDVVLDLLTEGDNTLFNFSQKEIDEWVGYDRRAVTEAMTESLADFKRGDYVSAILRDAWTKGQVITESIPMMVAMGYSGGSSAFLKGSKTLVDMNKKLEGLYALRVEASAAKDVDKMFNLTNEIKTVVQQKFKHTASMVDEFGQKAVGSVERASSLPLKMQAIKAVADKAGLLGVTSATTNDIIDQRIEGGDIHVDAVETMAIFASQFLSLGLDKFAFNKIAKVPEIKEAFRSAFGAVKTTDKKAFLGKLTSEVGSISKAMGGEAVQEYLQTWTEILGVKLGVNGKGVVDILLDEENKDEALSAMLTGATAGGLTHATGDAFHSVITAVKSGAVGSVINAGTEKVKEFNNKRKVKGAIHASEPFVKQVKKDINADNFNPELYTQDLIKAISEDSINHPDYAKASDETKKNIKGMMIASVVAEYVRKMELDPENAGIYKEQLLKLKEAGLTEEHADSFVSKAINNVITDLNERVDAIKGSDVSVDPTKINDELHKIVEGEGKEPESKGPISFFGKFDDLIAKYTEQRNIYAELGADVKTMDKAIATLQKYNTIKAFNPNDKKMSDVGSEIDLIGFIDAESGKIIRPSISAYATGLKESILSGNPSAFASLSRFSYWARQRTGKAGNTPSYTYTKQIAENNQLIGVVDNILKDESIPDFERETLELAKENLLNANVRLEEGLKEDENPDDGTKETQPKVSPDKTVVVPQEPLAPIPPELLTIPIKKRLATLVSSYNNATNDEHKAKLEKLAIALGVSEENLKKEFYDKLDDTQPKITPEDMLIAIESIKEDLKNNRDLDTAELRKYKQFLVEKATNTIAKIDKLNKRTNKVQQISKMEEIYESFIKAIEKVLAQLERMVKKEKKEINAIETIQKYIDTLESGKPLHHMSLKKLATDLDVTVNPKPKQPSKPKAKDAKEALKKMEVPIGGSEDETTQAKEDLKKSMTKEREVFKEDQGKLDHENIQYIQDTWTIEEIGEVVMSSSGTVPVKEVYDYIKGLSDSFTPTAPELAIKTITNYFESKNTPKKPKQPETKSESSEPETEQKPKPKEKPKTKTEPPKPSEPTPDPIESVARDEELFNTLLESGDVDPDMFDPSEYIFDKEVDIDTDFLQTDDTIDVEEVIADLDLDDNTLDKVNAIIEEFNKTCT